MSADYKSCDVNALLAASKCLMYPCRSGSMHDALDIGVRVANLAAAGGTDYSSDLNALLNDAKEFQALAHNQRKSIDLYIDVQNAVANGATIPTDLDEFLSTVECYQCLGHETKKSVLLFLKCQINSLGKPD